MTQGENPYESPVAASEPQLSEVEQEYLKRIASGQRHLNIAILLYLLMIILAGVTAGKTEEDLAFLLGLVLIGVLIYALVSAFRMARALKGTTMGIICLLVMLIPFVGLILLIVLNGKATKILKQHGIKVGLLGAKY